MHALDGGQDRTNSFAAARVTIRRCGLLPNNSEHLLLCVADAWTNSSAGFRSSRRRTTPASRRTWSSTATTLGSTAPSCSSSRCWRTRLADATTPARCPCMTTTPRARSSTRQNRSPSTAATRARSCRLATSGSATTSSNRSRPCPSSAPGTSSRPSTDEPQTPPGNLTHFCAEFQNGDSD